MTHTTQLKYNIFVVKSELWSCPYKNDITSYETVFRLHVHRSKHRSLINDFNSINFNQKALRVAYKEQKSAQSAEWLAQSG